MRGEGPLIGGGLGSLRVKKWLVEDNGQKGHKEMVILGEICAQGGACASNKYVRCAYGKHNVAGNSHRGPECINNMSSYF
jgi:hypothetical protein